MTHFKRDVDYLGSLSQSIDMCAVHRNGEQLRMYAEDEVVLFHMHQAQGDDDGRDLYASINSLRVSERRCKYETEGAVTFVCTRLQTHELKTLLKAAFYTNHVQPQVVAPQQFDISKVTHQSRVI